MFYRHNRISKYCYEELPYSLIGKFIKTQTHQKSLLLLLHSEIFLDNIGNKSLIKNKPGSVNSTYFLENKGTGNKKKLMFPELLETL